jgi:hypothetical protein
VAFQEDPVAALTPIRLLKTYRSVPPGRVIHATPALARRLVAAGLATTDVDGNPDKPRAAVERAVCGSAAEYRGVIQ